MADLGLSRRGSQQQRVGTLTYLLPFATKLPRLCFYTCLSVHGRSTWTGTPRDQVHPPGPGTPPGLGTPPRTRYSPPDQVHPLGPGTPPRRRLLLRTVRILLECILVWYNFCQKLYENEKNNWTREASPSPSRICHWKAVNRPYFVLSVNMASLLHYFYMYTLKLRFNCQQLFLYNTIGSKSIKKK